MSTKEQTSSRKYVFKFYIKFKLSVIIITKIILNRQWRAMVKKLRRKKIRQKAALERGRILEEGVLYCAYKKKVMST